MNDKLRTIANNYITQGLAPISGSVANSIASSILNKTSQTVGCDVTTLTYRQQTEALDMYVATVIGNPNKARDVCAVEGA